MFLNISNHPSDKWTEEQRHAVSGDIIDISFPDVDPTATTLEVERQAKELVDITLAQLPDSVNALVQGEFTMTFALVRALQSRDVDCFTATTKREVLEEKDGKKVSKFTFVAFRRYPDLT